MPLSDEHRYKILKPLEANPAITQRQLAHKLGISLGKVNYSLHALIERGIVKARNFKNSANKRSYIYMLTPKGIEDRAAVTTRFLTRKRAEYDILQQEIEELREEAKSEL